MNSNKKNILVIGGAGYIGSHLCKYLAQKGYAPVVLDNLSSGHKQAVQWGPFIKGDLNDAKLLDNVFQKYAPAGVMHLAAFTDVGESVRYPGKYYQNNVAATLTLLEAMVRNNTPNFIFSSSCSTYGDPIEFPISETHPQAPISPYGRAKLMVEQMLGDFKIAYGFKSVSLRYFNAAGADPDGDVGEAHKPETHLIPLVLQVAMGQRDKVFIFGDDYPTRDGTCIRDYIHVNDLAQAHVLALEKLLKKESGGVYNLGNNAGYSVMEIIETARKITGHPIPAEMAARRPGDPPELVGSCEKALKELGWHPCFHEINTIIKTAWDWHRQHPEGYDFLK